MVKALRHITGVKSSKVEKLDLKDLDKSPEGAALTAKYHSVEKHADRVGNGDDVYKGTTKEAPYKKQTKVSEETELDEISKNLALKYRKKSLEDTAKRAGEEIRSGKKGDERKEQKRSEGRLLAHNKTFNIGGKKAKVSATGLLTHTNEETELDEAAYSYKAARAGKDIGKPGKQFKKIASKAAEKYGSEERGKKVAGAILAKIRAKHGIKEESCNHSGKGMHCEVHGDEECPSDDKKKKGKRLLIDKKKMCEEVINEVAPPNPKIEKWINANKERFIKQYGAKKGKEVLYATAWKMHGQSESGSNPATNTDYAGPGAAGWTTGRYDTGTL